MKPTKTKQTSIFLKANNTAYYLKTKNSTWKSYSYLAIAQINPKLTYPFVIPSILDRQLNNIQNRIHPEIIANNGLNRNWPHQ